MDKKKLIYILSGVMGGIILLIAIIFLISSLGGKKLSYERIEDKLKSGAISYFKDNKDSLPKENGQSVTIEAGTLVGGKYIKELSEMVKEGVSCSAKVVVTKNGDNYLYSPMLNCGEAHQTKKLTDVIMSQNEVVTTGNGLYAEGDNYRFRGEYINNYVQLDESLWRILDIDKDGYIRLIYAGKSTDETYVWDDRYNIDRDEYVGINDYAVSRIKETLTIIDINNKYIKADTKEKLAYKDWCIGKRSSTNLEINNDEECETLVENQLFGLPYIVDYISASIDPNCKTIKDQSCRNYNYILKMQMSSWTLTGQTDKSQKVYTVSSGGYSVTDASNEKAIRPTVYLSNNNLYLSGDGTQGNPYKLK